MEGLLQKSSTTEVAAEATRNAFEWSTTHDAWRAIQEARQMRWVDESNRKSELYHISAAILTVLQEERYQRQQLEAVHEDTCEQLMQSGHDSFTLVRRHEELRRAEMQHWQAGTQLAVARAQELEKQLRTALSMPTVVLSPRPWEETSLWGSSGENGEPTTGEPLRHEEWKKQMHRSTGSGGVDLDLPVHRRFARAHQEALKVVRAQKVRG